jgi:hypothetical protein
VQPAPRNVSQALTELPPAVPPNEGLVLVVGPLAGLGIAALLAGVTFRVAGRPGWRVAMVVYLAVHVPFEFGLGSDATLRLSVGAPMSTP